MSGSARSLVAFLGIAILVGVAVQGLTDLGAVRTLIPDELARWMVKTVATCLAAVPALFSFRAAEKREIRAERRQRFRDAIAKIERTLHAAIRTHFQGEDPSTIRANVMIVSGGLLRMLASANMDYYDDAGVQLERNQGCAGIAWALAEERPLAECWVPVIAPHAKLRGRKPQKLWNLTEEQARVTSHILWIMSVPLFYRNGPVHRLLGILNFDVVGHLLRNPERLESPQALQDVAGLADRIAKAIVEEVPRELVNLDNISRTE